MHKQLSAPLVVQWEVTPWCNYNCAHCYNYWRASTKCKRVLTANQLLDQEKIARELVSNKVFHVTLTGGEPLGVLEQIFPILQGMVQAGIDISVNTNLGLLNNKVVDLLHKLKVRSILTSLLSADEKVNNTLAQNTGAFRSTTQGIKLAVSAGFPVFVNMVVSQKNLDTVYATGELAYSLGAKAFCATKVSMPANCPDFADFTLSLEQLNQMFGELLRVRDNFGIRIDSLEHYPFCAFSDSRARASFGKRKCSAAKTSCTIGFNGLVRPCSHAPKSYGSILEEGLYLSWVNMAGWRTGELIPNFCKFLCHWYPTTCGAGCRIEAKNYTGGENGFDPYCNTGQTIEVGDTKKRQSPSLLPDTVVKLSAEVVARQESFGYILYRTTTKWIAVDEILYDALNTTLEGSRGLTAKELAILYSSNVDEALKTLNLLKARHIVVLIA